MPTALPSSALSPSPTRDRAVLLVASAGCAMTVLDANVVGVVLPAIARDLNASFADIEWVISAYVLCFAAMLLPAGSIADRYGRKRVFKLGILAFAATSLFCGLAPSATVLYLARAGQGLSAAFLLAPALAVIGNAFHQPEARNRAWAAWGGVMGLTMVLAPLLGGLIGSLLGWRWAFNINLPICVILYLAACGCIDESREPDNRSLDTVGILFFTGSMFSATWLLIVGPAIGWRSPAVAIVAVLGLLCLSAFLRSQSRNPHPLVELGLFRSKPFVGAVIAMFAYASTAQVMASVLPMYLQNARGQTVLMAGASMLPFALAMLVFPHVGRRLSARLDSRGVLSIGLAVVAIGNLLMILATRQASGYPLIGSMAILGMGGGLLNGETQKAIMSTLPHGRSGMASGISTTSRFTGILLGFSGFGAVLASSIHHYAEAATQRAGLHVAASYYDQVIAGDLDRAMAAYSPAVAAVLMPIARDSYAVGFASAFALAAAMAAACALAVQMLMRDARPAR